MEISLYYIKRFGIFKCDPYSSQSGCSLLTARPMHILSKLGVYQTNSKSKVTKGVFSGPQKPTYLKKRIG